MPGGLSLSRQRGVKGLGWGLPEALDALAESVSRDGRGMEPVASFGRGHAQSL
jgi:hypothetical protein